MALGPQLTDAQWAKIQPLLPPLPRRKDGRGRPWAEDRKCLEGILWILRTGAQWKALPDAKEYASATTCWRRLNWWEERGLWLKIWRAFLAELDGHQCLDWSEAFIDGSFASAKKGALPSGKPRGGRAQSGWWWQTARVFLWEAPWPRPPLRKSGWSKRPSKPSRFRAKDPAGLARTQTA